LPGQPARPIDTLKERRLGIVELARLEVGVQVSFGEMVGRDGVPFAAFFVEADPPALPLGEVVLAGHADDGADPGEAVNHDTDEGAIAEADDRSQVDAVQQRASRHQICEVNIESVEYNARK
jgi:hypothetical protein